MKNSLVIILILLGTIFSSSINAQKFDEKKLDSIHSYLLEFQSKIKEKDTAGLMNLIYPLNINNDDVRKKMIRHIFHNDENKMGDFSFSNKAFDLIVDTIYKKITPISDELRAMLSQNEEFKSLLQKNTNSDIAVLDFRGAHIVLLVNNQPFQLYFWEGMNKLLKD